LSAVVADLRAIVPSLIKDARIPGLQIALIRDGKIAWHDNFGVKNASTGEPVADDTIFEAASFTKPLFAYYIMKEVDRGVLSLDKPLAGYISADVAEKFLGHPLDEKGFHRDWFEKITARQVLSHTSGMPHLEQGTPYPLLFEPGSKWKYSAGGYSLLQTVIETLKGDKLETLMQKEVLDPLGMTRSCLIWRDEYGRTMANGHDFFGQPNEFRKRTEAHAAASLYTTAEDYAKFVCAVLNGEGLRPETLKEMLTIQSEIDKGNEKFNGAGWSLGFGTQTDAHGFAIWQWGAGDLPRDHRSQCRGASLGHQPGVLAL
jgi:CubicO group peptidase (beta-lactamase class C family)